MTFMNEGSVTATNGTLLKIKLEARGGIEPPNKGFADLCLTAWLPRRYISKHTILKALGPPAQR